MGGVIISPNMKHSKERIDVFGNVINPETKEVIEKNEPQYVPTKEEVETKINLPIEPIKPVITVSNLPKGTIQQQIDQAKQHLADLEMKKKEEIAKRKAELAELEAS